MDKSRDLRARVLVSAISASLPCLVCVRLLPNRVILANLQVAGSRQQESGGQDARFCGSHSVLIFVLPRSSQDTVCLALWGIWCRRSVFRKWSFDCEPAEAKSKQIELDEEIIRVKCEAGHGIEAVGFRRDAQLSVCHLH